MGKQSKPTQWSQTPAAGFAAAVLAAASIGGIGWSVVSYEPASGVVMTSHDSSAEESRRVSPASVVHLVDINTASGAQLELLPGIGPVTAAAIIADREENGAYSVIEDLDRVRGIGPKTIESIRDWVEIDAESAQASAGG